MNNNDLVCCEPVRTISDNEREITEVLNDCVTMMNEFSDFANKSGKGEPKARDVECYSDNVAKNLDLAKILREQIADIKRAF